MLLYLFIYAKHKEVLAKNFCNPEKISENNLAAVWCPCESITNATYSKYKI